MRSSILLAMAGLLTCSPLPGFAEEPGPGKQIELKLKTADGSIPYLLYLPKNYGAENGQPTPLVLFLHGRAESEGPLSNVKKWGPHNFIDHGIQFPYVIASPQ